MTAGHCTCTTTFVNTNDHPKTFCKPASENQIVNKFNTISVFGGDKDKRMLLQPNNVQNSFAITKALLYEYPKFSNWTDIGILSSDKPMFNPQRLRSLSANSRPALVPICLASKNTDLSDKTMHGVGWGIRYDESPDGNITHPLNSNPYYSSCMTNEMGNQDFRFQACNMDVIKKNNWSCEKQKFPLGYITQQHECRSLFNEAQKIFDQTDKYNIEFMNKVGKIVISYEDDQEKQTICYRDREFREKGWCEVQGIDIRMNPNAWGFCSPSCDSNFFKVDMRVNLFVSQLNQNDYLLYVHITVITDNKIKNHF